MSLQSWPTRVSCQTLVGGKWASFIYCTEPRFTSPVAVTFIMYEIIIDFLRHTVGVNKNWTLVIVNFSAQDASILKISVTIFKRRSWGFQNTPSLQSLDDFEPSYGTLKKNKSFSKSWTYSINFKIQVNLKSMLFGSAITWLKIIQTLQVGGVLESSGDPLVASWPEKMTKTRVQFLLTPSVFQMNLN